MCDGSCYQCIWRPEWVRMQRPHPPRTATGRLQAASGCLEMQLAQRQCKQELFSWFLFVLIAHALSRSCLFFQGGINFIWIFFSLTKRMLAWTSFLTWYNFADAITTWCQPCRAEYGASPVITQRYFGLAIAVHALGAQLYATCRFCRCQGHAWAPHKS